MKKVSVVIPLLNMAEFVPRLVASLSKPPFSLIIQEIIFVCDKSTDGSEEVIRQAEKNRKSHSPEVVLIAPEKKSGHFGARLLGARAAKGETLFFIDARVLIPDATNEVMPMLMNQYSAMFASIYINTDRNIYCLYWQRSHESLFRSTYEAYEKNVAITYDTYENYRIGTTCFFCSKWAFLKACERFEGTPLFSDDTLVLKDLVGLEPIHLHKHFVVEWEPRNKLKIFLKHLYVRGPGFAEYHLIEKRGWLFVAVCLAVMGGIFTLGLLFINPVAALILIFSVLALFGLSAAFFAKSIKEFFILAPLQIGVILSYGIGALRGLWIVSRARSKFARQTQLK